MKVALYLIGSLAMCYSRMGVEVGLSGARLLPLERVKLCLGPGIHFVMVFCCVAMRACAYTKKPQPLG